MNRIVCEMCGSNDLLKTDGVFICQNCGTKYSLEEAKKMMIEGKVNVSGSTVKIDETDKINNYFKMANSAFESGNKEESETYCNKIIEIEPNNYKAWLLKGLSAGWQTTIAMPRLEEAVECFHNTIISTPKEEVEQIGEKIAEETKKLCIGYLSLLGDRFLDYPTLSNLNGIIEGMKYNINIAKNLYEKCNIAIKEFNEANALAIYNYVTKGLNKIPNREYSVTVTYLKQLEEEIILRRAVLSVIEAYQEFYKEEMKLNVYKHLVLMCVSTKICYDTYSKTIISLSLQKENYTQSIDVNKGRNEVIDKYNEYVQKIREIEPNYKPEVTINVTKAGCYVATCVYGSYDCPEVWTLRRYRDNTLSETWYGRLFIHTYYKISPTIVKIFGKNKWFKKIWKNKLDKFVNKLQKEGIENTPYIDKKW